MATIAKCVWCHAAVAEEGDTCGPACYRTWIAWHQNVIGDSPKLIKVQPLETVPKDLDEQPWYKRTIWSDE